MKIAIFKNRLLRPGFPLESPILASRKELGRRGHEIIVFTADESPLFESHQILLKRRLPIVNRSRLKAFQPELLRAIEDSKIELVHSFDFSAASLFGLRLAKRFRLPLVLSITDSSPLKSKSSSDSLLVSELINRYRSWLESADSLVVTNRQLAQQIELLKIKTPVFAIPFGLGSENRKSQPSKIEIRKRLSLPIIQKISLFAGPILATENPIFLLEAFKSLTQKDQANHLLVVTDGRGDLNFQLTARRLGLSGFATFRKNLSAEQLGLTFAGCDLFLAPSNFDFEGTRLLQALTAGLPTVAINRFSPREIVSDGETGHLSTFSLNHFVDRASIILENELLREKLSTGSKKAAERFSVEETTNYLERLYSATFRGEIETRHRPGQDFVYRHAFWQSQ